MEVNEVLFEDNNHVIMRGRYNDKSIIVKAVPVAPVSKLFTAHDQETSQCEKQMQNEVAINKYMNSEINDYVPNCYAADTDRLPYHMIVEHAQNGDLRNYLLSRRELNPPSYKEVLETCHACAKAMVYAHTKRVVHTQLSAKRFLVGENTRCIKLTGFGRARRVSDNELNHGYKGSRLDDGDESIRWADPAGLTDEPTFSFRTDVWAFGVTMYEIITCGDIPYAGKDLQTVRKDVSNWSHLFSCMDLY